MDRPPAPDTRSRILRTALDLFGAQGYQRTSLRQIADRLGLTKAGILYHFPSKEHLLVALAEPLVSDLEAALDRAARLPWPAARWAALEGWLDTLLRHRRPLGTLYHDMTLLARGSTYARIMRLATQAYDLVAGPGATRLERIRAIQATAMLGDPIVFFADMPDDELRAALLDGAVRLLRDPAPPSGGPAPAGTAPPARPDEPEPAAPPLVPARTSEVAPVGDARRGGTGPVPGARTGRADELSGGRQPGPEGGAGGRHPGPERVRPGRRRRAGRPPGLSAEQVRTARAMHGDGLHTVDQIAASLGVSRATLYRHLRVTDPTHPEP
ncbi:TetR family transcriptional regulator [Plantactinospora sp. KLBMP9567]|uniref:TetR family transcriptional regulator n=1 Tax=Plantactinospora sp. KLBMP9567 TaxID=3085900 RepID=UPI002981A3F3|nr:TetR family transcriptional regulator [Plantactinospora sp. KLBMP9567]MDW5323817.1 TetR family transcriptional regulator [Plantactinospora sp. KLBMP9567]